MNKNPLLRPFETPHATYPFAEIGVEDIEEAIWQGMEAERAEVQAIVENTDAPNFENTIAALDASGAVLDRATTVMYNLLHAETNDALDALAQKMSPVLSEHRSSIMLSAPLFAKVKQVYEAGETLPADAQKLLEDTYQAFVRSGADLPEEKKARFKEITAELSQLSLTFSQNCLKETNAYQLHITEKERLAGLPDSRMEEAALAAREKGMEGWLFTLHAPSYVPFLTYADDRELRRELYMAYNTKCTHDNEHSNFGIVARLVNLRRELAALLGYENYAAYVLKRRMAGTQKEVDDLLQNLMAHYREPALQEVEAVRRKARSLMGDDFELMPWDFAYYAHKLQVEQYDLDAELLRPYFELSNVVKGVFGLATTLYGVRFVENRAIPVYHPDVTAYEVLDEDGTFLAVLYTDFHPRETKQGGAWMTNYKEQWCEESGADSRPHVSVTMNFSKPTTEQPALLTLSEVETFLHEFGHALHGMFSRVKYRSQSGTNVYWDFVELPSQIMENYVTESDFLKTFAFHYQTGEVMPEAYISRIRKSRNFNVAYACMRQVSFGLLDMAYHTLQTPFEGDVRAFEKKAWAAAQVLPAVDETCMTVQFSHIMSGGYSAGYYSYKWAEVLDADAFSLFREQGIFNKETASRFRSCILEKGDTQNPMALYVDFRGRKPTIEALLLRNGITPSGGCKNEEHSSEKC